MNGLHEANELLLKTFPALAHADDVGEIVAALALCAEGLPTLRLLYFDLDETGEPVVVTAMASWQGLAPWPDDPLLGKPFEVAACPLIRRLQDELDPVWFVADAALYAVQDGCSYLDGAGRLAALKLYGVGQLGQTHGWHGVLCITWPEARPFGEGERYLFITVRETVEMIVSHCRLRAEALEQNRRLQELDRVKDEFLHSFSHELRTPLAGVLTLAESLLHDPALPEAFRPDLGMIRDSGEHLLELLADILDMAAIQAGLIWLQPGACDVAVLLEEVARIERPLAATKGLDIQVHLQGALPSIQVDPQRLRQALLNLLSNAIKFSERGVITLEACQEAGALCIRVRDQGIGIAPEHQALIFEPFRRIDSPAARRSGGTGLGLPIARRLVELHGGQIRVESAPGQGATFCIILPLKRENMRILYIEDERVSLRVLERIAGELGCTLLTARTGQEGLALVGPDLDLILMDIGLPDIDGVSLTRQIRQTLPDLPIVAVTANALPGDRARCLEAGCTAYINKPFRYLEMVDFLTRFRAQVEVRR
jgi:signal transduction histidine kinase/CheY-like chemotaxis protein